MRISDWSSDVCSSDLASTVRARSCAGGLARQAPQWLGPACSKGKGKAQLSQQGEPRKSIFDQHSRQKRWFSLTITPQAGQRGGSAKSMSGTAKVRKDRKSTRLNSSH